MKNIFFETHSTSEDNEKGIASGHLDPPLSERGRKEAENLGLRYEGSNISKVYTSDLKRSYETAEIAFSSSMIEIIKDSRLREWNYGKFNGYSALEIEKMKLSHINSPFPGGESLVEAIKRIASFIESLPDEELLIIGHRAVFYALEHLTSEISLKGLLTLKWSWQPGWKYLVE